LPHIISSYRDLSKREVNSVCAANAEIGGFGCESGSGCIELAFGSFIVVIAVIIAIAIVIPILAF
jgi:hypothetical protein